MINITHNLNRLNLQEYYENIINKINKKYGEDGWLAGIHFEKYILELIIRINDFDISKKKSGGIFFSKEEMHDLANKNKFSFIHNYSESSENYWILFKAKKE